MKIIYLILLLAWSIYTIIENGNLKPSDNYYLYVLSVVSIIFIVIGGIDLINDILEAIK